MVRAGSRSCSLGGVDIFDPPPGFVDLCGDAQVIEPTGELTALEIAHVGTISARRPLPRAAAALAMTVYKKVPPAQQLQHFSQFVIDHVGAQEYERLLEAMISGSVVDDAVRRVGRAVATWGTARPYTAVATLSLFTGHNWRTIRQKLAVAGIANPLALPSLHALLDVTEEIVVDGLFHSANKQEGPPSPGELKVQWFYDSIYAPDPPDPLDAEKETLPVVPSGFEDPADVEADFDAFMQSPR